MPKTIRVSLNPKSINAAVRQLEDYQKSLLRKAEQIRLKVAGLLKEMVQEGFNGSQYDDVLWEGMKVPDVSVTVDHKDNISVVIAHGKEAVFIEFGAGVYYNPSGSPHPSRPPGIVNIGEYGKGYGKRKIWGYYRIPGDKDSLVLTHGTPASAPMYFAAKAVAEQIPQIAREVFKGGDSTSST